MSSKTCKWIKEYDTQIFDRHLASAVPVWWI